MTMALIGDDEVELLDGDGGVVGDVCGARVCDPQRAGRGDCVGIMPWPSLVADALRLARAAVRKRPNQFRAGEVVRTFGKFLPAQDSWSVAGWCRW